MYSYRIAQILGQRTALDVQAATRFRQQYHRAVQQSGFARGFAVIAPRRACCVRVPAPAGNKRRLQEVTTHSTMTKALTELANRLVELRVERVMMEATSSYWQPVFYLLEAHGLDPWLVHARDIKHLPGRPKTDLLTELSA